jgi:hypothetical protein
MVDLRNANRSNRSRNRIRSWRKLIPEGFFLGGRRRLHYNQNNDP